jgi:hypothetical protein
MSEVPAAAVEAAFPILHGGHDFKDDPELRAQLEGPVREALAAAAPLIRQDERQAVSDELHDYATREYSGALDMACQERTMRLAARLVGGGGGG